MRTALSTLTVERPRSLAHALTLMQRAHAAGEPLVPLAGGTDLFVELNAGTRTQTRFLDLGPLAPLRAIRAGRAGVRIGAMATFDAIARHPALARWPLLPQAARVVVAAQIQNRATIGGNVANGSPAGDSLPVLLAYDAVVTVASVRGEREIPFAGAYAGYRKLAIAPDELLVAITLPPRPARERAFFRKVGTRAAQSISKVVFAGTLSAARGTVSGARLAWGSVAATPVRALATEAVLRGAAVGPETAALALRALSAELSPIDDIRSTGAYRASVARALLAQFLAFAHPAFGRGD